MFYMLEFDDEVLSPTDYASLTQYENCKLTSDILEDLIDYIVGFGYEWDEVVFVWALQDEEILV